MKQKELRIFYLLILSSLISCDMGGIASRMECETDRDCSYGMSCRSKSAGGTQCKPSNHLHTDVSSTMACNTDSDCSTGFACRSKVGGGTECRNSTMSNTNEKVLSEISPTEEALKAERRRLEADRKALQREREQYGVKHQYREQERQLSKLAMQVQATEPDTNGVVIITVNTNADTSSLKVNGEEQGGKIDGKYSIKKIARVGQNTQFSIVAMDINGNIHTESITVRRAFDDTYVKFTALNPANIKTRPAKDAVAIIIGISDYKSLPKAEYANDDARMFYDYAIRALGIKPENIKLLIDTDADRAEIYRAFKSWMPSRVRASTDVYVYYSGHGLPAADGEELYLLPQSVDRDLVDETAISQSKINAAIQSVKPKSVTIFLDSCYSGLTRTGETLVPNARPLSVKIKKTVYPENFVVISASSPDQISSSSKDLKHGIFSYYLMKGMEGDADSNKDGKITMSELQEYLSDTVSRQALSMNRKQNPQIIGDVNRVFMSR